MSNMANLYIEKGAYQKAIIFFEESYQLAVALKNSYNIGLALSGLSRVKYEQGDYQQAIEKSEAALKAFGENGTILLRLNCYYYLGESYEKIKNYKAALENQKFFHTLSDSLFNIEKNEQISNLKVQYEVNEKEAENQLLKAETDAAQKVIRQQMYAAIGLILSLIFAISLVVFIYRSNQKRKQLNEQLQISNEQLKEMDKVKNQFFANISHELKTPLTLIFNPLQKVLKGNLLDDNQRYLIKSAEKNSLQLFDLIYQILELTKFDNNKVALNLTPVNLKRKVGKWYADFESLAQSRKIHFKFKYYADENLEIDIDEYKLSIIVKNLISNAIKFTSDQGQVALGLIENPENIVITVSDTGRGIHVQDLPYVFDRYYQGKISGDIMEGGTGIGLAICKEYAELMGGSIRVESEVGQGSTFFVTLPKVISTITSGQNDILQVSTNTYPSLKSESKDSTVPTVLVVEDNINMQEYIHYILKSNYNVIIAPHGKAALQILDSDDSIDLVISDLMMPEMNGQELVEIMKQTPKFAGIPVIMLTALNGTDKKLNALRIGIDDYILKPFIDEELMARISNLILNSEERQLYKQITTDDTKLLKQDVSISEEDMNWLKQFEVIVQQNYKDFHFTIDTYTEELMMSRTKLYKKIKTLTGLTPKNYINEVRFKAARQLMENKQRTTVKAIAYEVGFKNQKYFSSSFKKRFGKSPSEYLK
ncbi:MAG: ATP-binding protein [Saprospiraceae bacterium]